MSDRPPRPTPDVEYEDWRYIQLRGDGSKLPVEKWGGYSQDFDDAPHVHTHANVEKHPADEWGVVDIESQPHMSRALLIFDVDIYKAPDSFNPDRVGVPEDTLITRSQSGGYHVYFALSGYERGDLQESDFQMVDSPGFDIDIRGSVVSHHVVAPADIPGVGGGYEIVNDSEIKHVFEPGAAAKRITLDGEPLLEFDPDNAASHYDFRVPEEPPEEMPRCYHAGLELRKAAPDDHPNTHKVNVLTAACGLAVGYDPEEVAGHFCGEWAPNDGEVDLSDKDTTEYQVQHIAENGYSPPTESTLRDYGILGDGEHCEECPIEYHGDPNDTDDDTEHHAILPAINTWDWREAGRQIGRSDSENGESGISKDRVQQDTVTEITDALTGGEWLVEVIPSGGKSYGTIRAASRPESPPISIFTLRGHEEQYQQIAEWCEEHGIPEDEYKILPSFQKECPTAAGDHGKDKRALVRRWYQRGATGETIHKFAEDVLGEPLPCQQDGNGNHIGCPYSNTWSGFDPDEYKVLIGHYSHAHNTTVISGRAAVFDEYPGKAYEETLGENLESAISEFLARREDIPYDDATSLLEYRDDDERRAEGIVALVDSGVERDERAVLDDDDAHADAPLAVYTLLTAAEPGNDLGNGWERAPFPDDARIGLHNREDGEVRILSPPNLDTARSVVALDGTPTKEMWEKTLGCDLRHKDVLGDDDTRAEYIRDALGIDIVLTTDAVKSYSCGPDAIKDRVTVAEDTTLLEEIAEKHNEKPGVITTKRAKDHVYEPYGTLEHADRAKHYGNILGSNEFKSKRVGVILGSRNFGPDYVKRWAAYLGHGVEPTFPSPENGFAPTDYGPVGNRIRTHMREHETLQALLRFGRDGNGATVYLHTNTPPEWAPIAAKAEILRTRGGGERQVLDVIEDWDSWLTADIVEHDGVDLSERRVRQILNDYVERGHLSKGPDPDDGRRTRWTFAEDSGLGGGAVDFGAGEAGGDTQEDGEGNENEEVAEISPISIYYTGNFRNFAQPTTGDPRLAHRLRPSMHNVHIP